MMQKIKIVLFFIPLFFIQCEKQDQSSITLLNDSAIHLKDKPIKILRSQLNFKSDNPLFPLIFSSKGDTIPSQLDDLDGDNSWDELFFVVDLKPNEEGKFSLKWVKEMPNYLTRTSVRFGKRSSISEPVKPALSETLSANELPKSVGFQKYQTDGPTWENDKVGFRHYLDGRNAKDVFGKKTTEKSPENVGLNMNGEVVDNYHVMEDWGRDILAVGNSIGIGGYGLLSEDKLLRLGVTVNDSINNVETTNFKIVTEGPVRSMVNYQYFNWNTEMNTYNVEETTTIWPGIYGYQNAVQISGLKNDENLVVGLVNINTEKPLQEIYYNDDYVILYTHDKQTYNKEWWLGIAIIVQRHAYLGFIEAPKTGNLSNTFLAKLKIENKRAIKYFAIACWELSDHRFVDESYFVNYLKNITNQLSTKVSIKID